MSTALSVDSTIQDSSGPAVQRRLDGPTRLSSAVRQLASATGLWSSDRRRRQVERILQLSDQLQDAPLSVLKDRYQDLRWRSRHGDLLESLVEATFALVRESARRTCGLVHFPVQVLAGLALAEGEIAEMRTGEGKTLTSLLAIGLLALRRVGCHVYTANDYLAARDAQFANSVLGPLGITVAPLSHESTTQQRRAAYACDVTYGTEKEFGFDFLRDRLRLAEQGITDDEHPGGPEDPSHGGICVQRGRRCALVDEADSILIDQARTPLIISGAARHSAAHLALFRWSDDVAGRLAEGEDYRFEPQSRTARLTDAGCRRLLGGPKPLVLDALGADAIVQQVELALLARRGFAADRDYIVVEGKIELVDESTGRVLEGRKWQNGLQQAIERRAGVAITDSTTQAASITVQRLLSGYEFLAGMTGTALPVARELKRDYRCRVSAIPTHRPSQLSECPPRIFKRRQDKLLAVADEVQYLVSAGRAVLIGTPSIRASEEVVQVLEARGIEHALLHARRHLQEAQIVAQAGQPRRVTVATNMAGRGTDIKLAPEVLAAGGLHVIATEMHSSARIDRQLIGRAGRQGDPGTYRFFLSLEDELLAQAGTNQSAWSRAKRERGPELSPRWLKLFTAAQRKLEKQHARQRRDLRRRETQHHEVCDKLGLNRYLTRFEDNHLQ